MVGLYYVVMAFGFPLLILALSLLIGYLSRRSDAVVLDWKPTRSPEREAELAVNDVDQMRASLHELRRQRGAGERPLGQTTEYPRGA
jgi:hypothetical protein